MKRLEIFLRHSVIKILKLLSRKSKSPSVKPDGNSKILIIRLNNLGDALVTTPLIRIIKKYTGAEIKVAASKRNYFIFQNNKNISEILLYDKSFSGFFRLLKKINSNKFDCIIDAHTDTSGTVSLLTAFSKSPLKVCLQKESAPICNLIAPYNAEDGSHIIEMICRIADVLKINYSSEDIKMEYDFLPASDDKVKYFLSSSYQTSSKLIGINFFAGSDARFWGISNYQNLISYLTEKGFKVIPISDVRNLDLAAKICPDEKIFCGSFDELAALVSKLDYLITPDTSLVHLCSIYNIPSFILFVKYKLKGSLWTPYKTKYESIITEEPELKYIPYKDAKTHIINFLGINE